MTGPPVIDVTVVHALPDRQWVCALQVPAGTTLAQAISRSGLLQAYPGLAAATLDVGVYNRTCTPDTEAQAGDRIEVYRPLAMDPKEARRLRAARNPLKVRGGKP